MDPIERTARRIVERLVTQTGVPFDYARNGRWLEDAIYMAGYEWAGGGVVGKRERWVGARRAIIKVRDALSFERLSQAVTDQDWSDTQLWWARPVIGTCVHRAKAICTEHIKRLG